MISSKSLTKDWISQIAQQYKNADEILIEKVIRALNLLEQLHLNGLDFIFKGGTALLLFFPEPKRFSIDIDIVLSAQLLNLHDILVKIIEQSDFIEFKEDKRKPVSKIHKQHFKFYYNPITNARAESEYILLDIVYADDVYGKEIQSKKLESIFVKNEGALTSIITPTIEGLLGDKLTAFAPMTTGVPYNKGKEIEIIKQLYDVANLFDLVSNLEKVKEVFINIGLKELLNRELKDLRSNDILQDIYNTSLLISTRGKDGKGDFQELQKGIRNIKNYIFSETFYIEKAIVCASKVAYLSVLLMNKTKEFKRYSLEANMSDWTIKSPLNTKLNKLKKSNPEAFFYWYQVYEIYK